MPSGSRCRRRRPQPAAPSAVRRFSNWLVRADLGPDDHAGPLRCAGCCWAADDLGAASPSAPATAGAIALIIGHALHLVVRLFLEKVPGRLPCPFIMRLGTFRSEEEQGFTNRRPASRTHGGANRQQRPALFAALPGAAPGCSSIPRKDDGRRRSGIGRWLRHRRASSRAYAALLDRQGDVPSHHSPRR